MSVLYIIREKWSKVYKPEMPKQKGMVLMNCYCTREDNIKIAKELLKQVLAEKDRTITEVYAYCRGNGITRGAIKEARKQLGVLSTNRDGEQYWSLPKEGEAK